MTIRDAAADDSQLGRCWTRCYDVHGLRLQISGDSVLASALQARLRSFPEASSACPDLQFQFVIVPDVTSHRVVPPSEPTRPVYVSPIGDVRYADATDVLYISCGDRVRLCCKPAEGMVHVSILQAAADDLWLISHPMLTLPVLECLKRRQRYAVHAAGVAHGGRAFVFPAASGAGKSTLTLSLLRAGFGFLGDDLLFLDGQADDPQVLAFPDDIDVTESTLRFFPELRDVAATPRPFGWPKRQVRAETRYGVDVVWRSVPAALVFPRIAQAERSVVRPLDPDEALLELISNVLLTDSAAAQAHLDALARLVEACPCYRLETGRDFDELPALVRGLLE